MYRIIGVDQKEYGPVSADVVRQWIREGRANGQCLAQAEGSTDWQPLSAFPDFALALLPPPPTLPVTPGPVQTGTNGFAVAGFILSLLGFCACFCCLQPFSLVGLILCCIGLAQTGRNPMQGGRGLAIAGIILSILGLFLSLGWMFFHAALSVNTR